MIPAHQYYAIDREGMNSHDNTPVAWIAEDDEEMRDVMGQSLRLHGFIVEPFANGDELAGALCSALDEGVFYPPDLVVTDVFMPGQTGLDAMARLRRDDWQIPVLVVTGNASPEVVEEAHSRLGALDILEKPFDVRRFGITAMRVV